ncbi:hypothetical protein C6569_15925 [Phreatobacter cathodiphilus]|uniref:Uncharacterized protein n=2 Tax=Phreatobacter cathodiphilus TaxID=1868589 RepID=A0A2S0NEP8_9HYPH|nr:hypothetical protein C6569_15925 [Phreatobacter cathodiphilus]
MLLEAIRLFGTRDFVGPQHNPVILGWAKEIGHPDYTSDETAWCGLFVGVCAHRAGWEARPKGNALWARNWAAGAPRDQGSWEVMRAALAEASAILGARGNFELEADLAKITLAAAQSGCFKKAASWLWQSLCR